jgi:hypothetical protein
MLVRKVSRELFALCTFEPQQQLLSYAAVFAQERRTSATLQA